MKKMWLSKFSAYMARRLVEYGLERDNQELYAYGIEVLLSNLFTILVSVVLSNFLKIMPEIILYWIVFIVMREYFHGYHSKNFHVCFVLSLFCSIGISIMVKRIDTWIISTVFTVIIGFLLIVIIVKKMYERELLSKLILVAITGVTFNIMTLFFPNIKGLNVLSGAMIVTLVAYVKQEEKCFEEKGEKNNEENFEERFRISSSNDNCIIREWD